MAYTVVHGGDGESVVIWASWSEFLGMGGYGFYVWGSAAMVVIVLAIEMTLVARRRRALFEQWVRPAGGRSETAT